MAKEDNKGFVFWLVFGLFFLFIFAYRVLFRLLPLTVLTITGVFGVIAWGAFVEHHRGPPNETAAMIEAIAVLIAFGGDIAIRILRLSGFLRQK